MKIFRISSKLSKNEILLKSKKLHVIPISSALARTEEQLKIAYLLAKRNFKNKTNLAKVFELEFLLLLAGERDLRKAFAKNEFEPNNFFIISFEKINKKKIISELLANEKSLCLEKTATPFELEKISLCYVRF